MREATKMDFAEFFKAIRDEVDVLTKRIEALEALIPRGSGKPARMPQWLPGESPMPVADGCLHSWQYISEFHKKCLWCAITIKEVK